MIDFGTTEAETLARLPEIVAASKYSRRRHGQIHFYGYHPTSPTGVVQLTSINDTPSNAAAVAALQFDHTLSPTEELRKN